MSHIPVASADVSGNEEAYVTDAIRSSWISSSGKYVNDFESQFATACEAQHALSCSNGTVALHLALLALGLRPGDEVIVPSLTYIATANAVRYCGAEPVFADVDADTWCLNPEAIENCVTPRTRGIIAVHLMGHPADMDAINQQAAIHGLWVVEDCAEAHFAQYRGRPVGALGNAGTFSFFGNKIFTCGEGGAVTLNDPQLRARMSMLRGQGVDPNRRYYFPITGYNYRLTNVACAMLCAQLERRDAILGRRREIFARYTENLQDIPGITFQPQAPWATIAPWMYSILLDEQQFGKGRDELMQGLAAVGIETRPFFHPLHRLPPFQSVVRTQNQPLDVTDSIAERGVMLPTFNLLSDAKIDLICAQIRAAAQVKYSPVVRRAA